MIIYVALAVITGLLLLIWLTLLAVLEELRK